MYPENKVVLIVNVMIINTDNLQKYSIGDGTDNKVELKLIGYLDEYANEADRDSILDNLITMSHEFSVFGEQLEEEDDDAVKSKFEDLMNFSFNLPLAESASATTSF